MNIASGIVVYILLWWWVFFMSLPFGVRRTKSVEIGHDTGAPEKPHLWKKALATTVLAAILWGGVNWVIEAELFSFRDMAKKL
jgi:predicted secreted protein